MRTLLGIITAVVLLAGATSAQAIPILRGYVVAGSDELHFTAEETDPATPLGSGVFMGIVGATHWASSAGVDPMPDPSQTAPTFLGYVANQADVGLSLPDVISDTDPSVTGPFDFTTPPALGVFLTVGFAGPSLAPAGQGETYLGYARMAGPIGEWGVVDQSFDPVPLELNVIAPEPSALLLLALAAGGLFGLRLRTRA